MEKMRRDEEEEKVPLLPANGKRSRNKSSLNIF